ncbi:hypothetical protein [Gallaecimonas mangrovi]|uniref:hypothetical protein n=1 Tax=Gallaecimonas mangrovi TaxID=2291597 RepID=UPI000E1FE68E|nr:hypothetical protein [Gallaecimonas mangrovi]
MKRTIRFTTVAVLIVASLGCLAGQDVYLYDQSIGGPYSDSWSLRMHHQGAFPYLLIRDGKSGDLLAPLGVNCDTQTANVGGGVEFDSDLLTVDQTREQIPDKAIALAIKVVCQS